MKESCETNWVLAPNLSDGLAGTIANPSGGICWKSSSPYIVIHERSHWFIIMIDAVIPSAVLAVTTGPTVDTTVLPGSSTNVVSAGGVAIIVWTAVAVEPARCPGSTMFLTAT